MAQTAVSLIAKNLGDLLIGEAKFLYGVRAQIEDLQKELVRMQCFLEDADARQDEDKRVHNWVKEIRELANKAEDLIQIYIYEIASRRRGTGLSNFLRRQACILSEARALHKVGSEIEAIKDKISNLTSSLQTYGVKNLGEGEGSSSAQEKRRWLRRSYSHVIDDDFVGVEEEIEILAAHMLSEDNPFRVVSICGMGGLGKTTLARKVYQHRDVRHHFDRFAWSCISQQWRPTDVLQQILIKLAPEKKQEIMMLKDEELVKQLHGVLLDKKCLVVLDDVWSSDFWNTVRDAFPNGQMGSKILLTSRNKNVALHIDPFGFIHEPNHLNPEQSWKLLQKKAFPRKQSIGLHDENMEKLGRKMVEHCKGLPLAIVVIGGILATKHTLTEWEKVYQNIELSLRGKGQGQGQAEGVIETLALSYLDLPYQLKPCFLYLGNFKEDYNIPAEKLCHMWVAEGFVSSEELDKDEAMMDVAENYLGELAQRCMVQVQVSKSTGRVMSCHLHDLMRDLCWLKGKEEKFLKRDFTDFKLLRTLDLEALHSFQKLPTTIGNLIHLRYLNLKNSRLSKLPSSVGNLRYLQTLDLRVDGQKALRVPNVLWKMEGLRHLYLPSNFDTTEKLRLDGLSNLETLEDFNSNKCNVNDLFKLANLRVLKKASFANVKLEDLAGIIESINRKRLLHYSSLSIFNCNFFSGQERYILRLLECPSLNELSIDGPIDKFPGFDHHFSPSLTKLTLCHCDLKEDPMPTLERFPNLQSLCLYPDAFVGVQMVCSARGFPHLKSLILFGLNNIENWRVDEGAMPSLRSLLIKSCDKLKMIPDGLRFVTTLQGLGISGMPEEFKKRVQVANGVEGEDFYKVQHIPSILMSKW